MMLTQYGFLLRVTDVLEIGFDAIVLTYFECINDFKMLDNRIFGAFNFIAFISTVVILNQMRDQFEISRARTGCRTH